MRNSAAPQQLEHAPLHSAYTSFALEFINNCNYDSTDSFNRGCFLRGVSSVTLKRRRKTSMDRAIEDIEQGRVYKYDSLDDLIKEIEG